MHSSKRRITIDVWVHLWVIPRSTNEIKGSKIYKVLDSKNIVWCWSLCLHKDYMACAHLCALRSSRTRHNLWSHGIKTNFSYANLPTEESNVILITGALIGFIYGSNFWVIQPVKVHSSGSGSLRKYFSCKMLVSWSRQESTHLRKAVMLQPSVKDTLA